MGDGFIGLMSGTSLDGVDGVWARFDDAGRPQVLAHAHRPFAPDLRAELLALNAPAGADELHRAALAGNMLARVQADVVAALRDAVDGDALPAAVGSHGQTVRHRPGEFDGTGYTLQLNNPALLAELTGLPVVADFRSRDVAAGGHGAPLVPAFHAVVFGQSGVARAVLNLGGIGNLTVLPADGAQAVRGFDCGPGNALMDLWVQRHRACAFDGQGAWAAAGTVHPPLLEALLDEPFLHRAPPKSTGRDLFNEPWLTQRLHGFASCPPVDVQATLAELTARAAADALRRAQPDAAELFVCGGGALNAHLMSRLAALLPGVRVDTTDALGLPPMHVEATAFAWLARACWRSEPGSRAEVTGARGARILGAIYPA